MRKWFSETNSPAIAAYVVNDKEITNKWSDVEKKKKNIYEYVAESRQKLLDQITRFEKCAIKDLGGYVCNKSKEPKKFIQYKDRKK